MAAIDAVFATPDLCALITERAFDPVHDFSARQQARRRPIVWSDVWARSDLARVAREHNVATLASLARVNRALARAPWPAAAGMAYVALGHADEATRRLLAPDINGPSPAALAARAAIQAKLEVGLAVVARACGALAAELGAAADGGAPLARAPGSAAERAYRACLLFSAVDALWRASPVPSEGCALLPEPPPQLARTLCAIGASARLPAELRAAAFSTLVAVTIRLARVADPQRALAKPGGGKPELPAPQLERLERAAAELVGAMKAVRDAIDAPEAWLGPLGLALTALLDEDGCKQVLCYGLSRSRDASERRAEPACVPIVVVGEAYPSLCRLFVDPLAPVGARSCAAVALERYVRWLYNARLDEASLDEDGIHEKGEKLKLSVDALDETGATACFRSLSALCCDGHGQRGDAPPAMLVMELSRALLLSAARQLMCTVDFELRAHIEKGDDSDAYSVDMGYDGYYDDEYDDEYDDDSDLLEWARANGCPW